MRRGGFFIVTSPQKAAVLWAPGPVDEASVMMETLALASGSSGDLYSGLKLLEASSSL